MPSRRVGYRAIVCVGGPIYEIEDENGRVWLFEMHRWSGPIPLNRKTEEPFGRLPGPRSPFWKAVTAWAKQGGRRRKRKEQWPLAVYETG